MKKQFRVRREALMIGGALTLIGWLIGWATPDSIHASPFVAYQSGMVDVVAGVISLLGLVIVFITILVPRAGKKPVRMRKCLGCGVSVPESSDLFCRTCGSSLTR